VACLQDVSLLDQSASPPAPPEVASLPGVKALYVGNLEPYQGIDLLLQGFALARAQGADLSLAVIGGAPGDLERYQALSASLGLGERAFFLGPRPQAQLGAYLAQADILVSPRLQGENTPMKIYSYLDSGKPVLATRLSTHTQVMGEGDGLLVEPAPQDLARGLLRLAAQPELRAELGRRGRLLIQRRHSREGYRRKLLGFYAAVERSLGKRGKRP
jgi:glycosyltransferase involved in cell wall biosynthesis